MYRLGCAGLATLFVISGYLISQSWENSRSPAHFFRKRCLRIFPAFIAVILFTFFLLGPLVTSLPLPEYFSHLFSVEGFASIPFFQNGSYLGLFTSNPDPYVNGSLWTIPVELVLYIILACIGILGFFRSKPVLLALIALNILVWLQFMNHPSWGKIYYSTFFFLGAYLYQERERLVYNPRIAAILAGILAVSSLTPFLPVVALAAGPYLVLFIAFSPVPAFQRIGKYGDYSYGMFIFSYPLQQTIVQYTHAAISLPAMIVLSFLVTLPVAWLSWNLIERKALALKNPEPVLRPLRRAGILRK
jgi:peptidoglycan/LPS O-acetylase OafA/YrhL